ncbi:hypothetical protein [Aeromonas caviae]|uniref:hypothetical protein n=1 Tax=Aeromonas caviae TaxID=648 RepID=UPI003F748CAE
MEQKDSLTEKMIKLLTDEMKESLKEEKEDSLTDKMKKDSEFQSKRKQLIVVSILLMAMSLSDANLKEANSFIFKIDFSNSAAFGWMVFFGVIVLMIRYYSFAFKYHFYLFEVWADDMMRDYRVFGYHMPEDDPGEYYPHGLFSKLKNHSCSRSIAHYDFERDRIKPTYKAHGFFKRTLHYDVHNPYEPETHAVNLNKFDENWTMKDYLKMINIEIKYQSNALFRQPEYLDISLPYFIATLSLLSFIFKYQILYFFQ